MNTYRRYQDARDMAWRALLQLREKRLPADVLSLAQDQGIELHSLFPDAAQPRLMQLLQLAGKGPCRSLKIRGRWHIFYDSQRLDEDGVRFAVAHELGHFFLSHSTRSLPGGVRTYQSRENEGDLMESPAELDDYAADIFAIRLLAPACLLHELHLDTPGGIRALCGMPKKAAALRAERMELLNARNVFFIHPLERQVRDQFLPFLNERKFPLPKEEPAPPKQPEDPVQPQDSQGPAEILLSPPVQQKRAAPGRNLPRRASRWLLPLLAFLIALLLFVLRQMQ